MSRGTPESARLAWRRALAPTPDCVPLDRIGGALAPHDRAHVETCVRCQAELELWRAFERTEDLSAAHDEAAVRRIAERIQRNINSVAGSSGTHPRTSRSRPMPWLALAAVVLLTAATAVLLRDASPGLGPPPSESGVSRSGTITVTHPAGDLAAVPDEFAWEPITGATSYELRLMTVDRSVLWSASTDSSRIAAHSDLATWAVPMKTLLWDVIARDARGGILARSEAARFRVLSTP